MNPFELFRNLFDQELERTTVRIPTACCLSTVGLDGFPNARFVSLKEVLDEAFIVTGPVNSRKGLEIDRRPRVALSFWWTETERQVRIQGLASRISDQLADRYFAERNRDSQIVSVVSEQGREVENMEDLNRKYRLVDLEYGEQIKRPETWGGYSILPVRMEFLEFKPTRFHDRKLFEKTDGEWVVKRLQP